MPTDLIESKGNGIFSLLDEESKLPQCSSTHFTTEVHRTWNNHFRLALPRNSRLKAHREIRDDEGFLVRHFAGAVCYQTVSLNYKNKLYSILNYFQYNSSIVHFMVPTKYRLNGLVQGSETVGPSFWGPQ